MSSTTTIRLPPPLKKRVAALAKKAGTSAHGFILEAIAEKAGADERRADFHAVADARLKKIEATGMAVPWEDMKTYVLARAAGHKAKKPKARKTAS